MQSGGAAPRPSALSNGGNRTVRFTLPTLEDYGRAPLRNDNGDADVVLRRDELKAMAVMSTRQASRRRRSDAARQQMRRELLDGEYEDDADEQLRLSQRRRLKSAPTTLGRRRTDPGDVPGRVRRGVSPISTSARLSRGRRANSLIAQRQILAELDFGGDLGGAFGGDLGGALGALDSLERRRHDRNHAIRGVSRERRGGKEPRRDVGGWRAYSPQAGAAGRGRLQIGH